MDEDDGFFNDFPATPTSIQDWLVRVLEDHRNQIMDGLRAALQEECDGPLFESLQRITSANSLVKHASPCNSEGSGELRRKHSITALNIHTNHSNNQGPSQGVLPVGPFVSDGTNQDEAAGDGSPHDQNGYGAVESEASRGTTSVISGHSIKMLRLSWWHWFVEQLRKRRKTEEERVHSAISGALVGSDRRTSIRRIDTFACMAIMLNTVTMLFQLQYMGHLARLALGLESDDTSWPNAQRIFEVFEHVFNGAYLLELLLRLLVLKTHYFYDAFNLLDFGLVLMTSVQLYILRPLNHVAGSQVIVFRLLRFLRTVRVLRVVRVMRMFTELRILVQTFIASMRALLWSLVFLVFAILLGALFLSFSLHDHMMEDGLPHDDKLWLYKYYGDASRATYTLFEVTMAGCWPTYFRPLIEVVAGWYAIFVVLYVSIVVFALTRIIGALFLKETLLIASNDSESQGHEQRKRSKSYIEKLRRVFQAVDTSGDGRLSWEEFSRVMANPDVGVILKMFDVEISDAAELFSMLDLNLSGEITFDDFLRGMTRMKGPARSVDIVTLMNAHDKMYEKVKLLSIELSGVREGMNRNSRQIRFSERRMAEQSPPASPTTKTPMSEKVPSVRRVQLL
jgi:hypothetical protein